MESMTQECGFKINAQINWIGALARDSSAAIDIIIRLVITFLYIFIAN